MSLYQWITALGEYSYRERAVPPHDLVGESELRAARAVVVARSELGTGVNGDRELPATRHLPDPYGPDPVVFGSVPRVRT